MAENRHTLELNGRRYNAMTGELLSDASKSVDGFLPATTHARLASGTFQAPRELAPKHTDIRRAGARHQPPHQLQHSKTLMRTAVHHPGDSLKRHLKTAPHTGALAKAPAFDITPKRSVDLVDPRRLKLAHTVPRSELVRRFAADDAQLRATRPAVAARAAGTYQQAAPAAHAQPATPAHQSSYDVFEQALRAANSHKEPYRPVKQKGRKLKRLRQITSISAATLAMLLIAGFVAYQNSTVLQLRLAASRAGFSATLPAWQPSGFTLGSFSSGPGNLTVSYRSQGGQEFTIAQSASNWDTSTLLSDYVYPNNETYDTISSAGTTIYTYGNNNATWVSGGIWYKLTSNGSLSNSEIVNLATSMQS